MNEWTWQDEAWRIYDSMSRVSYNASAAISQYTTLRMNGFRPEDMGPDDSDDGSAGVREPRRPSPLAPAGAATFVLA